MKLSLHFKIIHECNLISKYAVKLKIAKGVIIFALREAVQNKY